MLQAYPPRAKERTDDRLGTDSVAAKKGDYFQLLDIPLYDRLGGDDAMELVVDIFYRKVLEDDLVAKFFEDVDIAGQRLKQKAFLAMAFGGPILIRRSICARPIADWSPILA